LPPVKFGYRGLGELGLLVNFGPVIGLGAYYVQSGVFWALEPLLVSLVLGLMMWSEIVINEIPNYEEDRQGGKRNLVVRLGRENAIILFTAGLVAAYLVLICTVLFGIGPATLLAGLVSLPFAVTAVKILKKNYCHRVLMMPANLSMIRVHLLTGLAMAAAYAIYLLHQNGR
jgi:1,4-dihydroxy-2-naphthoate octaprenyltransferase